MNKEVLRNVRLGIFVVIGAILLIFGLYSIGSNKSLFGKTFRISSVFYDVNGLTEGNNVRYSGIDVGTVEKIEIINDSSVRVIMVIDDKVKNFIRKNSISSVGTDGLMGNKLVNISPGTSEASFVQDNDEIVSLRTVNTEEMLRTLELTNLNIAVISSNLKDITENVNKSRGTLYSILVDTTLSKSVTLTLKNIELVSNNLNQTSNQLTIVMNDLSNGRGVLGELLRDTTLSSDMRVAIEQIRKGSENFSALTNEANDLLKKINNGSGMASALINDTVMTNDLKQSLNNIRSASKSLDQDLEGLKHTFLLRRYFKRLKK